MRRVWYTLAGGSAVALLAWFALAVQSVLYGH